MSRIERDVAIIGAGTAGLAAERAARKAGATTILIDDRFAGTTCATVGCMPSKLLIAAGHAAHAVRTAGTFGIDAPPPAIDGAAVMRRVRAQRDAFVAATIETIDAIPEGIRRQGRARFRDASTLALDDGTSVAARAIVIATGSRPHVPEMFRVLGDRVLTNETLFELGTLPASIAVVGSGILGLELAQALVRLGVAVVVFDQKEAIAGLQDDAVEAALRDILSRELPFHLGVELVASLDDGQARLDWSGPTQGSQAFDYVLVAAGRPPALDDLGLGDTGLSLDEHGVPLFDRRTMRCGESAIFLAGDADADRPVLHEASAEGAIAGRHAACYPTLTPADRGVAFSIMFTDPPVAIVGKQLGKQLGEAGAERPVIGCSSYADQGRAKVEGRNAGLVRIYATPTDGRLTGACLVGPGMDHIGHLFAWAIERGETATALLRLPFYHPTFEEGVKSALRQICDTVHSALPSDRDDGAPPGG
ncbi:dihydrolipoyl dehydrogenase [Sphingomonas abietis]|uniref:Dihydrolipoyl dehydrogenase n=1 Tax=Sphingomonas abietis TaxID=3012344 RepID=A0ABY7NIL5_9SPHN|nr:dihydrolipoyl dehydrogenase [Sphingomonas abietis]WBO21372.1 dihydrolipoyl dehydrogenase [Sphingomonas abietis]